MGAAGATVAVAKPQHRQWQDWVGFLAYIGLAIWLFMGSRALGTKLLPIFAYEILIAGSFLIRRPLRAQLPGWQPQFAAYAGSFLPLVFLQFTQRLHPTWLHGPTNNTLLMIGLWLWTFGILLGVWTMLYLRRSFSLVPQARVLVTSGPYRLARHPIYLGYALEYMGMWIGGYFTLAFTLMLVTWLALTWWRTVLEEKVLVQAFPEYGRYQQMVGRFYPKLSQ